MILLSTNAQNIFWLGRYLTRIQYLCSQFPFKNNTSALDYAHAFCLPAFDASSLNEMILDTEQPASFHQQFQNAKNNIHDLRGVISAQSFAELNQLLQQAEKNAGLICDVCEECNDVLEAEEDELLFLFFSLGQKMEQLDRQIRLKQNREQTLQELDRLIDSLDQQGMASLPEVWSELKKQPDSMNYYHFSDHIDSLFEMVRL
ncbi:alpha-E domain-containing protein [uncultured Acinetobacter sp.]|uniref:alpha-E domain-containing protein n=1 Tax=uncultured Acinetobacter sp. TaxID=165433 RepID=UPI0025E08E70|nr:alpha-E domain-containing protein [uncultured Acinetobacter sp.]